MENEIYGARRQRLMRGYPDGLILIRGAGPEGVNPNFFYLTGIREACAALLLAPEGVRYGTGRQHPGPDYVRGRMLRQILFLPPGDPLAARWGEDGSAHVGSISAGRAGVDAVVSIGEQAAILTQSLTVSSRLYYVRGHVAALEGHDDPDTTFVATLRRRFFDVDVRDATPAVHEMRRVKDAEEVCGVERSVAVVAEALEHVTRTLRPGLKEHEVEAEIVRVYRAHGGEHAFEPIVACGPNATVLHYTENCGEVRSGELVLIDTGVSIDGYKADITRTYPVDGRFTERQREVYDAVLHSQERAIASCGPGALLGDIHAEAYAALDARGFGPQFVHGIGHHLGLETHDVGDVHQPLAPGSIVTVEPGAYLPDEGLGVRIEDDVLVTAEGRRVLSEVIPKAPEEIEQRMRR